MHYRVFHLKPARLHGKIKKGFLITRAQKCIYSQWTHFQHLQVCVFSVTKTNQNPFLIWPFKRAGFQVEHLYMCVYKRVQLKYSSKTLESDRLQHSRPPPVIAQQYSSAIVVPLRFHYRKESLDAPFKCVLIFYCLKLLTFELMLKSRNARQCLCSRSILPRCLLTNLYLGTATVLPFHRY